MSYHKSVMCDACNHLHVYESDTYLTQDGLLFVGEAVPVISDSAHGKRKHYCKSCFVRLINQAMPDKTVMRRGVEVERDTKNGGDVL